MDGSLMSSTAGPAGGGGNDHSRTIQYAANNVAFRTLSVASQSPRGQDILRAAGVVDLAGWALIGVVSDGAAADIGLNEHVDIGGSGRQRFIGFETDRLYRATLAERPLLWGQAQIPGTALYALAPLGPDEALFLGDADETAEPIMPEDMIDLGGPEVERIVIGKRPPVGTFVIHILYNGLNRKLRVVGTDLVQAVIERARALFGNPSGELMLVNEAGQTLNDGHSLGQENVRAGAHLQLRPRVVRGG